MGLSGDWLEENEAGVIKSDKHKKKFYQCKKPLHLFSSYFVIFTSLFFLSLKINALSTYLKLVVFE